MGAVVLVIVAMIAANPRGGADRCGGTGIREGPSAVRSDDPAAAGDTVRGDRDLWDEVFASQNLVTALKRVERKMGRGRCGWCRNARVA